jgi:hypothetical protein
MKIVKTLKEWKIAGKNKWGEKCILCGSKDRVQGHHFFPKKVYPQLMFDIDNYVPLCQGQHFRLEVRKEFDLIFQIIDKRGIKWFNRLRKKL